jgi:alpha/beta superfamily hydrolase
VRALIGLGLPVSPIQGRNYDFSFLKNCGKPKLFMSGAYDQFGPPSQLQAVVDSLPEPRKLVIIPAADHFFEGQLPHMREALERWLRETILSEAMSRETIS